MNETTQTVWTTIAISFFVILVVLGFMFIGPFYNVWSSGMDGKAKLSHADFERQVQVVNAKANKEAQQYNADAEVIRAGGVAKANNIIKNSITDDYIRYLWVKTLDGAQKEIIYVPTEGNLPLTEASRLQISK